MADADAIDGLLADPRRYALDLLLRAGLAQLSYEPRGDRGRGRRAWRYTLTTEGS